MEKLSVYTFLIDLTIIFERGIPLSCIKKSAGYQNSSISVGDKFDFAGY